MPETGRILDYQSVNRRSQTGRQRPQKPVITPELVAMKQEIPNGKHVDREPAQNDGQPYIGERKHRGGRVEVQWLLKPLTGLASSVQYPLATPSNRSAVSAGWPRLALMDR
jgi:hypothetical protein